MDTQNDGLEKVTPFEHGNCWYLCQISGVYWKGIRHQDGDNPEPVRLENQAGKTSALPLCVYVYREITTFRIIIQFTIVEIHVHLYQASHSLGYVGHSDIG